MGIMKTLTINGTTYSVASVVPATSVTIYASAWIGSGTKYSQEVTVPGVTSHTKVDLQPTSEQLVEFHEKVLGFTTVNDGGVVKVYAIGDKPNNDHTIQITLTEVDGTGPIRGNTVGTTMPRANLNQTDPTKADYVEGRENIPTSAEMDDDSGVATFKNAAGVALFTLDLSGLTGVVYSDLVISGESIEVTEGGTGEFTVHLAFAPSASQPVYLAVNDSTRVSVTPSVLTFTPDNYAEPQTVTVAALHDDDEDDNSLIVSITSRKVDPKQIVVEIGDDDKPVLVTDGLVLSMDYTGHVGDTSDTITDLASGLSFKNFSHFTKEESGIYGPTTYKYLDVIADDAKTAFLEKVKETGGFTVEAFGTCLVNAFYCPNYKKLIDSGGAQGWGTNQFVYQNIRTNVQRILQDDTTDNSIIGHTDWLYTLGGNTKTMQYLGSVWPYKDDFVHVVITYSANGEVNCFLNGVKCNTPVTVENFKAWDFDAMFGGSWSVINNWSTEGTGGLSTYHRIYNRVLTDEEVQKNMRVSATALGLTTFQ